MAGRVGGGARVGRTGGGEAGYRVGRRHTVVARGGRSGRGGYAHGASRYAEGGYRTHTVVRGRYAASEGAERYVRRGYDRDDWGYDRDDRYSRTDGYDRYDRYDSYDRRGHGERGVRYAGPGLVPHPYRDTYSGWGGRYGVDRRVTRGYSYSEEDSDRTIVRRRDEAYGSGYRDGRSYAYAYRGPTQVYRYERHDDRAGGRHDADRYSERYDERSVGHGGYTAYGARFATGGCNCGAVRNSTYYAFSQDEDGALTWQHRDDGE